MQQLLLSAHASSKQSSNDGNVYLGGSWLALAQCWVADLLLPGLAAVRVQIGLFLVGHSELTLPGLQHTRPRSVEAVTVLYCTNARHSMGTYMLQSTICPAGKAQTLGGKHRAKP